MSKNKKDGKNSEANWPKTIRLSDRLPEDHKDAGCARYGRTKGGNGRFDRLLLKDVPQHLVDAALAKSAEDVTRQPVGATA